MTLYKGIFQSQGVCGQALILFSRPSPSPFHFFFLSLKFLGNDLIGNLIEIFMIQTLSTVMQQRVCSLRVHILVADGSRHL